MSFRRLPFQFSSTDPVERQAELEKRFGLPAKSNMYVDVANPLSSMGAESSGSPRLQHRVPIFMEGYDQPIKSSVDTVSSNADAEKKPNVRVIPIEIEGVNSRPSSRHRTFSGPSAMVNEKENSLPTDEFSRLKRPVSSFTHPVKVNLASAPKVHSIPIQVEGRNISKNQTKEKVSSKVKKDNSKPSSKPKVKAENPSQDDVSNCKPPSDQKVESPITVSLRKIEEVLKDFVSYEAGVKEFNGTAKDKQYRYLDEMLTRCMLRLDDVDTLGNEEVRLARKNAVKKVQASVDLLDTKVNPPVASAENCEDVPLDSPSMDVDINSTGDQKTDLVNTVTDKLLDVSKSDSLNCEGEISDVNIKDCKETEVELNKSVEMKDDQSVKTDVQVSGLEIKESDEVMQTIDADIPEIEMTEDVTITATSPGITDINVEVEESATVPNELISKADVNVEIESVTVPTEIAKEQLQSSNDLIQPQVMPVSCESDVLESNVEDVDMEDVSQKTSESNSDVYLTQKETELLTPETVMTETSSNSATDEAVTDHGDVDNLKLKTDSVITEL